MYWQNKPLCESSQTFTNMFLNIHKMIYGNTTDNIHGILKDPLGLKLQLLEMLHLKSLNCGRKMYSYM